VIRVLAKSSATLLGLFLAIGFVVTTLRPYVDQGLVPVLALAVTAIAGAVAFWAIRHYLHVERQRAIDPSGPRN